MVMCPTLITHQVWIIWEKEFSTHHDKCNNCVVQNENTKARLVSKLDEMRVIIYVNWHEKFTNKYRVLFLVWIIISSQFTNTQLKKPNRKPKQIIGHYPEIITICIWNGHTIIFPGTNVESFSEKLCIKLLRIFLN